MDSCAAAEEEEEEEEEEVVLGVAGMGLVGWKQQLQIRLMRRPRRSKRWCTGIASTAPAAVWVVMVCWA